MHAVTRRGARRAPLSAVLAFAIVPILFNVVIVATRHARLTHGPILPALCRLGVVTASALSHWGIYTSLLLMFALTLRPGRDPLITAMARRMHGELSGEMIWYTRRVTQAWCCFFAFQLTVSVTLFCFGPLVLWSIFVNLLDIPMVVVMFAAEYFCRLRCLRDPPRHSLAAIFNMVTNPAGNNEAEEMLPARMAAPD